MTLTAGIITKGYGSASGGGGGGAINTPVLAVADNGDGTGAVATITNATGGTTNTVRVVRWDGGNGPYTFTSGGSRSGNGNVSLALAVGWYWGFVSSTDGTSIASSDMVKFLVTDEISSVYWDVLNAVRDQIAALALPGDPNCVVRKLAPDQNLGEGKLVEFPAIVICPERDPMPAGAGTNGTDDVIYGVWVIIVEQDNREKTIVENLPDRLHWRERIAREFRQQRLSGVDVAGRATCIGCAMESANVTLKDAWMGGLFVSGQLLRVTVRETRGN